MSAPGAVVVGTGFGCRVQVPALRAAGFEVLALVGTDRERTARRAERLGVPEAFDSFEAVLALDGVVAVAIATPPSTHAALAIAAADAGKHVVCEKPFALDAPEAQRMLDAAESAGVVHLVGHEFRWAADRATAARAIAEGRIGEPRLATFFATSPLIADPGITMPAWWFDPAAGGGWLGASGSHAVDQVRAWLGEFESLSADLVTIAPRAGGVDDTFSVRFRLASGVVGTLQQTSAAWGRRADTTRVTGTSGALRLERGTVVVADADGDHELPVPDDLTLPELPPQRRPPPPVHPPRARPLHATVRDAAGPHRRPARSHAGRGRDLRRRSLEHAGARRDPGVGGPGWGARPPLVGHHGVPKRSRYVFSATGARRGGPSDRAGHPRGTTATGSTWSGSPTCSRSTSPSTVGSVVSAEPSPSACAPSRRFCTAGKIDAVERGAAQRVRSAPTTTRTGAPLTPPVAPGRRRRRTTRRGGPAHSHGPRPPMPAGSPADGGAGRRVAHDDEHPRLGVLRARRERRRFKHLLDERIGYGFVGERAVGAHACARSSKKSARPLTRRARRDGGTS